MNIALWVVQGILALAFLMAGAMKSTQPKDKLAANMTYMEDFSQGQIRTIGILEVLAAIGLVVPLLTGILPILTPLAALGLVLTMVPSSPTCGAAMACSPWSSTSSCLGSPSSWPMAVL